MILMVKTVLKDVEIYELRQQNNIRKGDWLTRMKFKKFGLRGWAGHISQRISKWNVRLSLIWPSWVKFEKKRTKWTTEHSKFPFLAGHESNELTLSKTVSCKGYKIHSLFTKFIAIDLLRWSRWNKCRLSAKKFPGEFVRLKSRKVNWLNVMMTNHSGFGFSFFWERG